MSEQETQNKQLSRRGFMIGAGAAGVGLTIGFATDWGRSGLGPVSDGPPPPEVNAWVHIAHDDTVTVRIARSEMGQGTLTGLAQLVAEELDCDWEKVKTEYPTPGDSLRRDRVWGAFATGGSQGVRGSHDYMRQGGAAARLMLLEAAAKQWGVSADECRVKDGIIVHTPSGKKTSYGRVADMAAQMPVPEKVTLKDPKDWRIAGQAKSRVDTREKLDGSMVFGADIDMPGLVNASVRQCPIRGGKLKSFDASAVDGMKGLLKLQALDERTVVAIADSWWTAEKALSEIDIEWDDAAGNAAFSTASYELEVDEGLTASTPFVMTNSGDFEAQLGKAEKVVEATYRFPWQEQAPMEPMNATVIYTADKCEAWVPTQDGETSLKVVAGTAGLPIEKCEVYKVHLGGGFGRRGGSSQDYTAMAVNIAKLMPGTPVKMMWSREETTANGFYHPFTKARLRGTLDKNGNLTGMHFRISGQSILKTIMPNWLVNGMDLAQFQGIAPKGLDPRLDDQAIDYDIDNLRIDHAMVTPPVRPGFWRGVNINQNTFYMESFMDELAHAAGRDALEFRLSLLPEGSRNAAVLKAVAEKSGWGKKDGRARGLAVNYSFGSYTAACAEVTVNADGELKIHRIVAATDPGHAVNPQQIDAQVAGSFAYGLSAALYSEISFEGGEVQELNFDSYPNIMLSDMPEVETIVMPSGGFWGGVGEPTICVAAPAVINAIHNATGKRIRNLPLKDQPLRDA